MIGKIKRGASFGGVCRYVLKGDKEVAPRIIGGNMEGTTPDELAAEFEIVAAFNSRVKSPVKHFSVAFAPEDGDVSDDVKILLALEYMEKMGYGNNQYVVVVHDRSDHKHDHDHIHIVANAVSADSKWVSDWMNWKDSQKVLRELETKFELTPVLSTWDKKRDKPASTHHDRRVDRLVTSGVTLLAIDLDRRKIQNKIDIAAPGCANIPQFCARLQSLGVDPIPRITRTGKVQGLSYKCGEVVVRGSDLNSASFPALQSAHGIGYDERRDLPSLKVIAKGGQLEADRNWLDRLPEIQADLDDPLNVIPIEPKDIDFIIDIDEAQAWALADRELERDYDWGR